ncbi:DnaJ family domain-containing protein [Tomitella gaofuii]|uniref:DnaJ family domain-containing protein n=1 Tax=Tomitella gaofuii TaxID=2760083 RepID=UPI0015F7B3D0|nr:DnaJ family domain-containing protein [Tomitella gaofuii]
MTERKPAGMTVESWVERQIRVAAERGDLDGLPGTGKPIPPSPVDDDMGWVRRKLEEEGLSTDALLPMSLQLRREIDRLPRTLADIDPRTPGAEAQVRSHVAELNRRIAEWIRAPSPPVLPIAPVAVDAAVARWRAEDTAAGAPVRGAAPTTRPVRTKASTASMTEDSAPAASRVTVYWRPGCVFCQRLRAILWARRLRPTMINIWEDARAAAFVRSVADGNETVPTVVIDGAAHVNPAPKTVVAALRRR